MATFVANSDLGANVDEDTVSEPPRKVMRTASRHRSANGRTARGLRWCITINPKEVDDVRVLADPPVFNKETMYFMEYVKHKGEQSGLEHYHVYIQFKDRKSLPSVKSAVGCQHAHCELLKAKSEDAYLAYMEDGHSTIDGPFKFGQIMNQGHRSDYDALMTEVKDGKKYKDIMTDHPKLIRNLHYVKEIIRDFGPRPMVSSVIKCDEDLLEWQKKALMAATDADNMIIWAYSERKGVGRSELCYYMYSYKEASIGVPGDITNTIRMYIDAPIMVYDLDCDFDVDQTEFKMQLRFHRTRRLMVSTKYEPEVKVQRCSVLVLAYGKPPRDCDCFEIINIDVI